MNNLERQLADQINVLAELRNIILKQGAGIQELEKVIGGLVHRIWQLDPEAR